MRIYVAWAWLRRLFGLELVEQRQHVGLEPPLQSESSGRSLLSWPNGISISPRTPPPGGVRGGARRRAPEEERHERARADGDVAPEQAALPPPLVRDVEAEAEHQAHRHADAHRHVGTQARAAAAAVEMPQKTAVASVSTSHGRSGRGRRWSSARGWRATKSRARREGDADGLRGELPFRCARIDESAWRNCGGALNGVVDVEEVVAAQQLVLVARPPARAAWACRRRRGMATSSLGALWRGMVDMRSDDRSRSAAAVDFAPERQFCTAMSDDERSEIAPSRAARRPRKNRLRAELEWRPPRPPTAAAGVVHQQSSDELSSPPDPAAPPAVSAGRVGRAGLPPSCPARPTARRRGARCGRRG